MKKINPYTRLNFLNIRDDKTIHLGIQTNILCVDDRLEAKYLGSELNDFTATLYLGKIIFSKNKQGNLAPKFIPTTITDSSFNGLNTFWLNEINKKAKKPFKSMIQCNRFMCVASADSIPYQKIHYFRHKDNIVLTKEQIISYFTELHRANTDLIQGHIDSINVNRGIKAYHLNDRLFEDLAQKGILPESMIKRYANSHKIVRNNALDLIALDYLAKTNQSNFKIALYDELFYAYLVWSLREFLIPYFSGRFQDENNLLFNAGDYKKYAKQSDIENPYEYKLEGLYMSIFYDNILPTKHNVGYIEGYELFFDYYGLNFSPADDRYLSNLPISKGYKQISPNQKISEIPNHKLIWMTKAEIKPYTKSTPSPLGKYYFELSDNKGVFIEFFNRIYPSISNLPKGWSKEMMRKLDLKLE